MRLEDSMDLNPNELDGGTVVVVLDCGGLEEHCWLILD